MKAMRSTLSRGPASRRKFTRWKLPQRAFEIGEEGDDQGAVDLSSRSGWIIVPEDRLVIAAESAPEQVPEAKQVAS